MDIFRIGFALAGVFIGAITAFMGLAVTALSLRSGEIGVTMSKAGAGTMITRLADPASYWTNLAVFGLAPLVLGLAGTIYAWRRLKNG